jgi:hypothetical protein
VAKEKTPTEFATFTPDKLPADAAPGILERLIERTLAIAEPYQGWADEDGLRGRKDGARISFA